MLKQSLMRSSLTAKERADSQQPFPAKNHHWHGRDTENYGRGDNFRLPAQSIHANALWDRSHKKHSAPDLFTC